MHCRKCGAAKITKRRAGVFSCNHCGVQPGQFRMDRTGIPGPAPDLSELNPDSEPYVIGNIWTPNLPAKGFYHERSHENQV